MSEICLSYKPKIILTRKCYYNIKGNEMQNPGIVDLILRKRVGNSSFDEIVVGDVASLNKFKEKIEGIVSPHLFKIA